MTAPARLHIPEGFASPTQREAYEDLARLCSECPKPSLTFAGLLVGIILAGCQTVPAPETTWTKPDMTNYRADDWTCRTLATPVWGGMQAGPMRWTTYADCMDSRGYVSDPPFTPGRGWTR